MDEKTLIDKVNMDRIYGDFYINQNFHGAWRFERTSSQFKIARFMQQTGFMLNVIKVCQNSGLIQKLLA